MKITKFVHACLLVETPQRVGLIDPGQFSWESGLFEVNKLERLDDLVITHEHFDHMFLPFIQAVIAKFPTVVITTTPNAAAKLQESGIAAHTKSSESVQLFTTPHESTEPMGAPPQNTGLHYLGQLTHPGDSHSFTETRDILALPVTAPWGYMLNAARLGVSLKPKTIIPIHDWHWNNTARRAAYDSLQAFFAKQDITFIKPTDGVSFEV